MVAGLESLNAALKTIDEPRKVRIYRSKYLNNTVERDHHNVERRIRPMMGFKSLASATATLDGIETAHMIKNWQLGSGCPCAIFMSLAA